LLTRLWVCDDDIGVENEVGFCLWIGDDREILPLQDLGDGPGQRLSAVSGGALDAADPEPGVPAGIGLGRGVVLQQGCKPFGARRSQVHNGVFAPLFPIARRGLEPFSALAERLARRIAQLPDRDEGDLVPGRRHLLDPADELIAADAGGLVAGSDLALLQRTRHRRAELFGGCPRCAVDRRDRHAGAVAQSQHCRPPLRRIVRERMRQRLTGRQQHGRSCDRPSAVQATNAGYDKSSAQVTSRPTRQKAVNRIR